MKQAIKLGVTAMLLASVTACVTINIYFPAAAAEKAADKIIDNVWQLSEGINGAAGQKTDKDKEGAK